MEWKNVATVTDLDSLDQEEILEGYRTTLPDDPEPGSNRSRAFWHGWRVRMMDYGLIEIDDDHRQLVREVISSKTQI